MANSLEANRISLYQVRPEGGQIVDQHGKPFDTESYSRFKYGDGDVAARYGYELADMVAAREAALLENDAQVVITSSAFKHVPTASHHVAVNMYAAWNHKLYEQGKEASASVKIHRKSLIDGDYAAMTDEEREREMEKNKLYVDQKRIEKTHLFVVDDARITGRHEEKIHEIVKELDLLSVWYLYVVELEAGAKDKDPKIEDRMNSAYVDSLNRLADVIATRNFLLNARTCKHILKWENPDELRAFLASQDSDFLHTLYTGSVGDGYGFMEKTKSGIVLLKQELEKRHLLVNGRLVPVQTSPGMSRYTRHMDVDSMEASVKEYERQTAKEQEQINRYEDAVVTKSLKQAITIGRKPGIIIANHDAIDQDEDTFYERVHNPDESSALILVSYRPAEMFISERTRLQSPNFNRPVPLYGKEADTGRHIYIDPAYAVADAAIDAPVIISSDGTAIHVLQERDGKRWYEEDLAYRSRMEADSEQWRVSTMQVVSMIDPKQELGKLSVVEDPKNYRRGKARYAPADLRVMYHIKPGSVDPEVDENEGKKRRERISYRKRQEFRKRLALLQEVYPQYVEAYEQFMQDEENDDAYEVYQSFERRLRGAGIQPNPELSITQEDLANIHALENMSEKAGSLSIHLVPKKGGVVAAVNWVLDNIAKEVQDGANDIHITTYGRTQTDIALGLYGIQGSSMQGKKTVVIAEESKTGEQLVAALQRKNRSESIPAKPGRTNERKIEALVKRMELDIETGKGTFLAPLSTEPVEVVIADLTKTASRTGAK